MVRCLDILMNEWDCGSPVCNPRYTVSPSHFCVKQPQAGEGLCTDYTHKFCYFAASLFLPSHFFCIPSIFPVMSGNSADSYSEGESEGEQVKEKPEVPTTVAPAPNPTPTLLYVRKGKNNGRVGRPKKLKNTQPPPLPPPPPPANRRRGSGQPKSGLFGI